MIITEQNLVGVKRASDNYFFRLEEGQFWRFTEKMVEVHDQNGKVQGFRKKSIQCAETIDQVILSPFI